MSVSFARVIRISGSCPKDFDFQFFAYHQEGDYPMWMSPQRLIDALFALPESVLWNVILCILSIANIVILSIDYVSDDEVFNIPVSYYIDIVYNAFFFLDIFATFIHEISKLKHEKNRFKKTRLLWFVLDLLSFSHYAVAIGGLLSQDSFFSKDNHDSIKMACYYLRMHRPLYFIWLLLDYYLIGDIFSSLLKYIYYLFVIRVTFTNLMIWFNLINIDSNYYLNAPKLFQKWKAKLFYRGFYYIYKLLIAVGPDQSIVTDVERIWSSVVMMTGSLVVTGITIASLSIIIDIYLRPEETFRARFHLIMADMEKTNVPSSLREKVETFYHMYWHKQRAVSVTKLLPTYPHTLASAISTDIYFEAQQKSRVLRDLSYQFLSEIAKHMQTINYIPGDTIVKRNESKSAIIYISYGDVEMLTAEDDETPILRFTRGSIINPCGCSVQVASTPAHVGIRAATFCTAHVLTAADLWRVTAKYGKANGQAFILRASFVEHFERVKLHYATRSHSTNMYKSSILALKRNLMELKAARDSNDKLLLARTDVFLEIAGCYIMRNRKDTMLTEESDPICLRPTFPCILQPISSLQIVWLAFVSLLTLVVTFIYPFCFVYLEVIPKGFRIFDYLVSFVYILDIITHLSTGETIEEGVPVTFTHTSTVQIQSIWFAIDLISVAPIFEFIGTGYYVGINKMLKLLKVFRVLKLFEDVYVYQAKAIRFFSYCLVIVLMCYLVAVFNQGMLCYNNGFCEVTSLTEAPYWSKIKGNDENIERRLLYGLYWSISIITFTTHKTYEFSAKYWSVQALVLIIIMICTKICIMIESTYSATIMGTETMRVEYNSCIQRVRDFFIKNNVNPVLRQRFIKHLELCWFTDKAYSITHAKTSILFDLPSHVYQDIMAMQRRKYLLCIPFMKYVNVEELKVISSHARLFYASPNEILLNTGDVTNEIYVIKQGFCEILSPITKKVVTVITARNYFGDLECLLRLPAFYTVRAVTHVQVFSISRKFLFKAISSPKIKDAILYARKQAEHSALMRRHQQFLKYEVLPPPPNLEAFPLPRKHELDVAFLYPFNRLGFFSILRYVFPRYTIRPDGKYLKRYEWVRAVCAFMSANIFPIYYTLVLQWPGLWHFCWLLDLSAYLDIIQRMLVGYFDEKGILVYHPASTAAHYIRSAFLLDLFACLPLEALDNIRLTIYVVEGGYLYPETLQYFMYNRLLQLYRVPKALEILNDYTQREDIIYLIKTIPLFMATLVVMTSLLMSSSVRKYKYWDGNYNLEPVTGEEFTSWIENNADVVGYNITGTSWNLVLTTFYWVTYELTNTGFNIFQPNRMRQLYYLVVGMTIGAMMTTYFTVRIISIRANVNQTLAGFQQHMADIVTFMRKEKLDNDLQQEVVSYYEYMWNKTGGTNYRTVLKMCDQITLRTDAILQIYGTTFAKCPILYHCEQSLLRVVGRAVDSCYYQQNIMIIERDEVVSDMYLVDQGTVAVFDEDDDTVITKLPRGSLFGNLNNTKTELSPNRFVACSNIHLLKIESRLFYHIIHEFPTVTLLLKNFRPENESYIIGDIHKGFKDVQVMTERVPSPLRIKISSNKLYDYTDSKAMQIYLILVSLMCTYMDIYNAGFLDNSTILIGILYVLDLAFFVKIIVYYILPFVTYEDIESINVYSFWRKRYNMKEFWSDLISCLPLELFCLFSDYPWDVFVFLRLNRALRAVTVYYCLERYHRNLSINLTITTVTAVCIWFFMFVHSATCMWYLIGRLEEVHSPKSSWRYNNKGEDWCQNHYLCSLYFILTTFTQNGVGDILPRQKSEVAFVCLLMLVSNMVYMVYVGEFSNILQYRSFRSFSFYGKYLELKKFLGNNRVSSNLVDTTEKYTLYLWREARGRQVPRFLSAAPQCLRLKIMSAAYMQHLTAHPVFKKCEPIFLRHLVGCFKPYYYNENMYVVREGELMPVMYFVHKGRVQEYDEDDDLKIKEFVPGQHFGLGLYPDIPYTNSYKTIVKSQVLILHLNEWEYLLKHFSESKDIIYNYKSDEFKPQGKKRVQITKKSFASELSVMSRNSVKSANEGASVSIRPKLSLIAGVLKRRSTITGQLRKNKQDIIEPEAAKEGLAAYPKPKVSYAKEGALEMDKAGIRKKLEELNSSLLQERGSKEVEKLTSSPEQYNKPTSSKVLISITTSKPLPELAQTLSRSFIQKTSSAPIPSLTSTLKFMSSLSHACSTVQTLIPLSETAVNVEKDAKDDFISKPSSNTRLSPIRITDEARSSKESKKESKGSFECVPLRSLDFGSSPWLMESRRRLSEKLELERRSNEGDLRSKTKISDSGHKLKDDKSKNVAIASTKESFKRNSVPYKKEPITESLSISMSVASPSDISPWVVKKHQSSEVSYSKRLENNNPKSKPSVSKSEAQLQESKSSDFVKSNSTLHRVSTTVNTQGTVKEFTPATQASITLPIKPLEHGITPVPIQVPEPKFLQRIIPSLKSIASRTTSKIALLQAPSPLATAPAPPIRELLAASTSALTPISTLAPTNAPECESTTALTPIFESTFLPTSISSHTPTTSEPTPINSSKFLPFDHETSVIAIENSSTSTNKAFIVTTLKKKCPLLEDSSAAKNVSSIEMHSLPSASEKQIDTSRLKARSLAQSFKKPVTVSSIRDESQKELQISLTEIDQERTLPQTFEVPVILSSIHNKIQKDIHYSLTEIDHDQATFDEDQDFQPIVNASEFSSKEKTMSQISSSLEKILPIHEYQFENIQESTYSRLKIHKIDRIAIEKHIEGLVSTQNIIEPSADIVESLPEPSPEENKPLFNFSFEKWTPSLEEIELRRITYSGESSTVFREKRSDEERTFLNSPENRNFSAMSSVSYRSVVIPLKQATKTTRGTQVATTSKIKPSKDKKSTSYFRRSSRKLTALVSSSSLNLEDQIVMTKAKEKPKSFMQTIKSTIKRKLNITSFGNNEKDSLLLEEDEAVTNALLNKLKEEERTSGARLSVGAITGSSCPFAANQAQYERRHTKTDPKEIH